MTASARAATSIAASSEAVSNWSLPTCALSTASDSSPLLFLPSALAAPRREESFSCASSSLSCSWPLPSPASSAAPAASPSASPAAAAAPSSPASSDLATGCRSARSKSRTEPRASAASPSSWSAGMADFSSCFSRPAWPPESSSTVEKSGALLSATTPRERVDNVWKIPPLEGVSSVWTRRAVSWIWSPSPCQPSCVVMPYTDPSAVGSSAGSGRRQFRETNGPLLDACTSRSASAWDLAVPRYTA
mmetsp:Transcript_21579/g.56268  ORF Transcript_21579/g.56268 Transcript_21579/m.56268 type:complete len:247 (-) Transcript_21579:350-1090(-)